MNVLLYHEYSELDQEHEFGIVIDPPCRVTPTSVLWFWFHLGEHFALNHIPEACYPYPYQIGKDAPIFTMSLEAPDQAGRDTAISMCQKLNEYVFDYKKNRFTNEKIKQNEQNR